MRLLLYAAAALAWSPTLTSGAVDTATPTARLRTKSLRDGATHVLVFSDEFEEDGRTFDGDASNGKTPDAYWTSITKPDDTNKAQHFYNASGEWAYTQGGSLRLRTAVHPTEYWGPPVDWGGVQQLGKPNVRHKKDYTSAMVMSWNKFCFTGGVLEMKIRMPGLSHGGALWPAAWLLGNLGRATFADSTQGIWPWSYDRCDDGDHAFDGPNAQRISRCNPNPGPGLHPFQGRGAPEIDIFEASAAYTPEGTPFAASSLQYAPGVSKDRPAGPDPVSEGQTWYKGLRYGNTTKPNQSYYGRLASDPKDPAAWYVDSVSAETDLPEAAWLEEGAVFRVEWEPGPGGLIEWYINDKLVYGIDDASLRATTGGQVPAEPMYFIFNTAISPQWAMPSCDEAGKDCAACYNSYNCADKEDYCALPELMRGCGPLLPAEMLVDYVRVYQQPQRSTHTLGCDPPGFPTAVHIATHAKAYEDWKPPDPSPFYERHPLVSYGVLAAVAGFCALFARYVWRECARATGRSSADERASLLGT